MATHTHPKEARTPVTRAIGAQTLENFRLETGGRDLRKDVAKLLRDARRDVERMNKAVLRDVERLQKELATAAKAKASRQKAPARKPRRRPTARGGRSRAA